MFPTTTLVFPWPPTVNTYYRNVKGRTLMSKKGRMYRGVCLRCCVWQKTPQIAPEERVRVILNLFPPNKRKFDIDNRAKACLDALQHGGVLPDDEQVDQLIINRCAIDADERVEIIISPISPEVIPSP